MVNGSIKHFSIVWLSFTTLTNNNCHVILSMSLTLVRSPANVNTHDLDVTFLMLGINDFMIMLLFHALYCSSLRKTKTDYIARCKRIYTCVHKHNIATRSFEYFHVRRYVRPVGMQYTRFLFPFHQFNLLTILSFKKRNKHIT